MCNGDMCNVWIREMFIRKQIRECVGGGGGDGQISCPTKGQS